VLQIVGICSRKVNYFHVSLCPFKRTLPACYQYKESLPLDLPRVAAATSVTDWLLEATKNFQEQLCSWQ